MQKLELRNNLFEILNAFKINEILNYFDKNPVNARILLNLLVESRTAYDVASVDPKKIEILKKFKLSNLYDNSNYTNVLTYLAPLSDNPRDRAQLLGNDYISQFYSYARTLNSSLKLIDDLLLVDQDLFNEQGFYDIKTLEKNGNLSLEVINDGFISLKKLEEILNYINNLIDKIYLFYDKVEKINFEQEPLVSLIDSGSDININLKVPEEASKTISELLKDIWEAISNNRSFRMNKKLKDVESSIKLMEKITNAKNDGIIENEMEAILKKEIFINAVNLISSNTLPRELVMGKKEFSNRDLLLEQTRILQIGEGAQEEAN